MGFKYRPLFKSDLRELLANVMQVKKYVASLDHHDTYKEQLELIENNLSSYSFKSLKYLASERKKLLSIERELLHQVYLCNGKKPNVSPVVNFTIIGSGAYFSRKIDLTSKNKVNTYVTIKNIGNVPVRPKLIVNEKDWTTLESISYSILQEDMIPHQKALAIWKFVRDARYHFSKPLSSSDSISPIALFNQWGYSNCGETSRAVIALAKIAGFEAREVRLRGHIVAEVFFDEKWHMLDADGEVLFYDKKGALLSVENIQQNLFLLKKTRSPIYSIEYLTRAYSSKGVIFNPKINLVPLSYTLRPGESIKYQQDNGGYFFSGADCNIPPLFSNGTFTYVTKVKSWEIITFSYPYPIVGAKYSGKITPVYFSTNGWKWQKLVGTDFSNLFNNGFGKPDYKYYLKCNVNGEISISTIVQMATKSLPLLELGKLNAIKCIDLLGQQNAKIELTFGLAEMSASYEIK